jgi:hypothetical protein
MATAKSTLTFITESLSGFTLGEAQNVSIEAIGGTPPYSFELTQGVLPAGLNLNADGTLSGTPSGDTTIWIKVTDAQGAHVTQAFDLSIGQA